MTKKTKVEYNLNKISFDFHHHIYINYLTEIIYNREHDLSKQGT